MAKKIHIPATKDNSEAEIDNGGMDHSNTIDLRKAPDYDQYRMVVHYDHGIFSNQCNELSKLGWEPAFAPYGKGNDNNYFAQQWVYRVKKEVKVEIKEPLEVKIIGTVVTREFDEDDY